MLFSTQMDSIITYTDTNIYFNIHSSIYLPPVNLLIMILCSDKVFHLLPWARQSCQGLHKEERLTFATEYDFNYTHLPWLISVSVSFLYVIVLDRRANQQKENRNHTAYKTTVNHLLITGMEDLQDRVCWEYKPMRAERCWWWHPHSVWTEKDRN